MLAYIRAIPLARRIIYMTVGMLIVIHGGNALFIKHYYDSLSLHENESRDAQARLLAEHAGRTMSAVDLSLETIAETLKTHLPLDKPTIFTQMLLDKHRKRLPQIRAIFVADQYGQTINHTRSFPPPVVNIADRQYFSEQKKWRGDGLYIDKIKISRIDGGPFFAMSWPILDNDGNFQGIVAAITDPKYFAGIYGASELEQGQIALLELTDGTILAGAGLSDEQLTKSDPNTLIKNYDTNAHLSTYAVPDFPAKIVLIGRPVISSPQFLNFMGMDIGLLFIMTTIAGWLAFVAARESQALHRSETAEKTARLRAEEANQAKTMFLANMSHELRTPLNAIIGFSEMIERSEMGPISNTYRQYGEIVRTSGQHLLSIINDILDVAKLNSGKTELHLESVDVTHIIAEAISIISKKADSGGVQIMTYFDMRCPRIEADPIRLRQVLLNILTNAVKFTPDGGHIDISTSFAANELNIVVRDTGIGMASEDIPRALEPFTQISKRETQVQEGTGLGLPISKSLIELHGGRFELASTPKLGTTVMITLPVQRTIQHPSERSAFDIAV